MQSSPDHPQRLTFFFAVLMLWAAVYGGHLFAPGLLDDADATHAEAAREMVERGDWVTLHVNGIRYLEKAPLMYWMVAAAYTVFGQNEFATRLPLALGVLLSALLLWAWARRAFGGRAAAYAALMAPVTVGIFLFTRILIPEVWLSLLIAAALFFFLTGLETRERWRWYAGYAAVALAVLTKGLVALVFVGATTTVYLGITGEWRSWREFRLLTGLAPLLLIAAPWHLLAGLRNEGFFWFYFVNEHFLRFLGQRYPKDYNKLPALVYWTMHLVWLLPWSLWLPAALRRLPETWRSARIGELDFAQKTRVLYWVLAAVILVFFSFSTNQEYYTFPAYLPLLLLLADALARAEQERGRWLIVGQVVLAVLGTAAAAVLFAGLWQSRVLPFVSDIGTVLERRGVGGYTLSMSHFFDLTAEAFAALRLPAAIAALALLAGSWTALLLRRARQHFAATVATALTAAVFLIAAQIALARFGPYLSSKPLAHAIAQRAAPQDRVLIYGDQAFGSSLLFYLQRPIYLVNGRSTSMEFGSRFPDAPRIFLNDDDLRRLWASGERVFLFVPREHAGIVEKLGLDAEVVAQVSGKTVYTQARVQSRAILPPRSSR